MGFWLDSTVEVTYKGKTTRVAKTDAHLYKESEVKEKKVKKESKTDK